MCGGSGACEIDGMIMSSPNGLWRGKYAEDYLTPQQVCFWPEASVLCVAAVRPESEVKPICRDSSTDGFDQNPDSPSRIQDWRERLVVRRPTYVASAVASRWR